jgi:hypothetical protein
LVVVGIAAASVVALQLVFMRRKKRKPLVSNKNHSFSLAQTESEDYASPVSDI